MVDSVKGGGFVDGAKEAGKAMAKAAAEAAAKAAAAAAAEAAAKAAAESAKTQAPGEGFDGAKKKPLSITGKHKPPETPVPNASLQDEVAQARLAATAGGTPSTMTPGPGGVNKTDNALPSASGKISKAEWDNPQKLLTKLTQYPSTGPEGTSDRRCGPSGVMGASIMQGPEATAKYLNNVADAPKNNRLSDTEKKELKGIADKVKNKEATFEDMNRAQALTYMAGNRVSAGIGIMEDALNPATSKLNDAERDELKGLAKRGLSTDIPRSNELLTKASGHPTRVVKNPDDAGYLLTVEGSRSATDRSGYTDREVAELAEIGGTLKNKATMKNQSVEKIFKDLKPGESAMIRVSMNDLKYDDNGNTTSTANHYVTVGRRPDGTAYIYNSDPSKGDPTVFVGGKGKAPTGAFAKELGKYELRRVPDAGGKEPEAVILKPD